MEENITTIVQGQVKSLEVICQNWMSFDRWNPRDDHEYCGISLHLIEDDRKNYLEKYWSNMPKDAPEYYEKVVDKSYCVKVSKDLYAFLEIEDLGIRVYPCGLGLLLSYNQIIIPDRKYDISEFDIAETEDKPETEVRKLFEKNIFEVNLEWKRRYLK